MNKRHTNRLKFNIYRCYRRSPTIVDLNENSVQENRWISDKRIMVGLQTIDTLKKADSVIIYNNFKVMLNIPITKSFALTADCDTIYTGKG